MKNAALLVSALFLVLAVTGCKSDIEKYSDDICGCSDKKGDDGKKCIDDVTKKWQDKMPKGKDDTKMKDMSDKDKEAFGKAMACSMKMMDLGK